MPTTTESDDGLLSQDVLLLPGWMDSGPGHWQTEWALAHGAWRLPQDDWLRPRRGDWSAQLEEALIRRADAGLHQPVILAAHSLGCHLVANWAAHTRRSHQVAGALLVAPPDLSREDLPPALWPWRPAQASPLPFPSLMAVSSDDPYAHLQASAALCQAWGSSWWNLGPRGHLNADSGLGAWPEGWQALQALRGADPQPESGSP